MYKHIPLDEFCTLKGALTIINSPIDNGIYLMDYNMQSICKIWLAKSIPADFKLHDLSNENSELTYHVMENGDEGKNWLYILRNGIRV